MTALDNSYKIVNKITRDNNLEVQGVTFCSLLKYVKFFGCK